MADPDSSELVHPKHITPPLFGLPAFFVGFGAKAAPDSDAGRSPTSPLDFGVFANFGGLFSPRSPPPSSPTFSHRNKWVCHKVGLSVLTIGEGDDALRDNVLLAPQIKLTLNRPMRPSKLSTQLLDPCLQSNSLPINYATASLSDALNIPPPDSTAVVKEEELNSPRRSSSSPMDIISNQAYSPSLSGIEMALSEDYTCIISHGPNPKTTHIFGNCILDCDPKEMGGSGTEGETEKPEDCQSIHSNSRYWLKLTKQH